MLGLKLIHVSKIKVSNNWKISPVHPCILKSIFSLDYSQFWISMHLSVFIISTACIFSAYSSGVQGVGCVSNQKEDGSRQ